MSAIEQWRRELAAGTRTVHDCDGLWAAACHEVADRELAAYVRPQQEYVEQLRGKARDVARGRRSASDPLAKIHGTRVKVRGSAR